MSAPATEVPTPRLKTRYRQEIVPALQEQFDYGNPM
jgi:large subunit ribosomal protein L5